MNDAKSQITAAWGEAFIDAVDPQAKRDDARVLDALFRRVTGTLPKMCGPGIIGYGEYRTT